MRQKPQGKDLIKMNNEQNQKKELKKLPGFYIALCCCVLVIGLAGYFTERSEKSTQTQMSSETTDNESVFSGDIDSYTEEALSRNAVPASETITQEEYASETASDAEEAAAEANNEEYVEANAETDYTEDYTVDNPDVEDAAVIVSAESSEFEAPVNGDILEGFSAKLVYNTAMSDWRTHDGIDLAADTGCSVHAAANGTVKQIISSALGDGIEIEHANGYITRYIGLGSIENLNEGDSVNAGDVIGLVGESKGESVSEPHLHFEIYKDGEAVDPKDFI